ncbi:hypothetical protein Daus18300_000463 [Diaporthe australafricana]|uniref:Uncharacterized protein n=1 Tax=Diaporthe australafricana TaxID=127596 RepID=A0ABR3Y4F2_9PEZI
MATASRTLSPGGALLRASRMFSLPQAIPPPPGDYQAATSYNSETATQAYPTLQTVTAPENFRQRGDWGFKRNFPMRSTAKTSTPYLRVKQVDSIEHVTDFASAADHALTLEKWQEMNVAISLPHSMPMGLPTSISSMGIKPESVFENKYDFTAIDKEKIEGSGQMRWKYEGPWLAKLTEGEFQKYIKKVVRPRRTEFRQFLRQELAPRLTQDAKISASEKGGDEEAAKVQELRPEQVTEAQLTAYLRELRSDRHMLFKLVGKFLDLAPIEDPEDSDMLGDLKPGQSRMLERRNPYAEYGPPITHPSAGLSYLRTTSFLDNHPAYGPLKYHPPVKGRVLGSSGDLYNKPGSLGVGGFVVGTKPVSKEFFRQQSRNSDPNVEGGQKAWAHIFSAQVSSHGRVMLHAEEVEDRTNGESRLVQQEMLGEKQVFHKAAEDSAEDFRLPLRGPRSANRLNRRGRYVDPKIAPGHRESYGIKGLLPSGRDQPQ